MTCFSLRWIGYQAHTNLLTRNDIRFYDTV